MRIRRLLALVSLLWPCSADLAAQAAPPVQFLPERPPSWGVAVAAGGCARAAVIVTADRYQTPAFDAPSVQPSGEVLRRALAEHAGFARAAIVDLAGEQVHEAAVQAAIERAARRVGDGQTIKRGTLLVVWVGHGFTQGSEQQLFGYYTQQTPGGFAPAVAQRQLAAWLDAAHESARARGVDLTTVLVVDACSPNLLAPPKDAVAVRAKAWQVFSAKSGRFALAGAGAAPSVFSQAFADAVDMRAKQSGTADLEDVFRQAKELTEQRSKGMQVPELLAPLDLALAKAPPAMVVPRRVGFTVRLVDALAGARVERARVRLDDAAHETGDSRLALAAAPGSHQLEVHASGYLTRAVPLVLGDEQADRELTVPLLPDVTVLRVRVSPPRVVEVRAQAPGARAGYHVLSGVTDVKGEVELRVPAGGSNLGLQVLRAGRELQTASVEPKATAWLRDASGQHTGIPFVEAPLALAKAVLEQLGDDLGAGIADAAAPKARPAVRGLDAGEWQAAQQNIARERWDLARVNLLNIEGGGDEVAAWRRYVDAHWAREGLETALADGRARGDFGAADEVLAWWKATDGKPSVENKDELARLLAELERERVPLTVRQGFEAGNQAYAAGELEKALAAYTAVRAQANASYGQRIDEQVDDIKTRLYTRHLLAGNQHEADGDVEKAKASYRDALKYSDRARRYLARLDPQVAAVGAPVADGEDRSTGGTRELPPGAARLETGIGLVMIRIEGQEFEMGSLQGEAGRDGDELRHRVKITKAYWIGETEVTQGQWRRVMGTEPWKEDGKLRSYTIQGDDVAATYVSWTDAMEFCRKLTEQERVSGRLPEGYRYILPTEAEWELACRAGTKTAYCFGDDEGRLREYAAYSGARSGEYAHVVKQRKANGWGLYDMHGNVAEWCLDEAEYSRSFFAYWRGIEDPYAKCGHVRRGGSWLCAATFARSASRDAAEPSFPFDDAALGLRPVLAARSDVK